MWSNIAALFQANKRTLRRFLLHTAFGVAALGAGWVVQNVSLISTDQTTALIIVTVATAAASFFRGQEQENSGT